MVKVSLTSLLLQLLLGSLTEHCMTRQQKCPYFPHRGGGLKQKFFKKSVELIEIPRGVGRDGNQKNPPWGERNRYFLEPYNESQVKF